MTATVSKRPTVGPFPEHAMTSSASGAWLALIFFQPTS
jgi:hypothetical protein